MDKKPIIKERKYKKNCVICNKSYFAADVKGCICYECKSPKLCKCGCGQMTKSPRGHYCPGHHLKGKTYKEIYGTDTPKCGYQKGANNIAKNPDIRKKISEGVKQSYINDPSLKEKRRENCGFSGKNYQHYFKTKPSKDGNMFRSSFEVEFSDFLYENSIKYLYEKWILMCNDHYKIVDFIVDDKIIEVTGYAFEDWQNNFNKNIKILRKSINNDIIIITYNKWVDKIKNYIEKNRLDNIIVLSKEEYKNKIKNYL